jgi:hypothetical protein
MTGCIRRHTACSDARPGPAHQDRSITSTAPDSPRGHRGRVLRAATHRRVSVAGCRASTRPAVVSRCCRNRAVAAPARWTQSAEWGWSATKGRSPGPARSRCGGGRARAAVVDHRAGAREQPVVRGLVDDQHARDGTSAPTGGQYRPHPAARIASTTSAPEVTTGHAAEAEVGRRRPVVQEVDQFPRRRLRRRGRQLPEAGRAHGRRPVRRDRGHRGAERLHHGCGRGLRRPGAGRGRRANPTSTYPGQGSGGLRRVEQSPDDVSVCAGQALESALLDEAAPRAGGGARFRSVRGYRSGRPDETTGHHLRRRWPGTS